jgi:hypothetical protein
LDIDGQENSVKAVVNTPKAKVNTAKANTTSSSKATSSVVKPSGLGEYAKTSLDQRELKIARQRVMPRNSKNFNIFNDFKQQSQSQHDEEEEEEEEEEEDEALAVPQFYKYQRRLKINEEKNRIDYMSLLMVPPAPSSSSSSSTATNSKQQETPVRVRLSLSPIAKTKSPKNIKSTPKSTKSPSLNRSKTFEPIFKFAITKASSTPTTSASTVATQASTKASIKIETTTIGGATSHLPSSVVSNNNQKVLYDPYTNMKYTEVNS